VSSAAPYCADPDHGKERGGELHRVGHAQQDLVAGPRSGQRQVFHHGEHQALELGIADRPLGGQEGAAIGAGRIAARSQDKLGEIHRAKLSSPVRGIAERACPGMPGSPRGSPPFA
jgi:hypothetical protein